MAEDQLPEAEQPKEAVVEPERPPIIIMRPHMERRTHLPNVGAQDMIDIFDFFGYDLTFQITPREHKDNAHS